MFDWKQIRNDYNKLKCPTTAFAPNFGAFANNKYNILLSERNTGKTTAMLLVGLLLNARYGTVIQYIRNTVEEVRPKDMKIFDTIVNYENGRYIKQITNGAYNTIIYYRSSFFYAVRDEETFDILSKGEEVCHVLTIDRNFDYKSSYNAPYGDFIIWDEFVGKNVDAMLFLDLVSTIVRDRENPVIVMLSNTINSNSKVFEEFCISKEVKRLQKGDKKEIITSKGTHIYIEVINKEKNKSRSLLNSLFFGFDNPRINSITGENQSVWAVDIAPHILRKDEQTNREVFVDNVFIEIFRFEFLKLVFCYNDEQGYHLEITRSNEPRYEDDIILTTYDLINTRYRYGIGQGKLRKTILNYYDNHKIYYGTNEIASDFKNYLYEVWKNKRTW